MKGTTQEEWCDFYSERVGDGYHQYFKRKYSTFLNYIEGYCSRNSTKFIDAGCGIGSITKSIYDAYFGYAFDISEDMVRLAMENNIFHSDFRVIDIFNWYPDINEEYLLVTHGVLEHFTDNQIKDIIHKPTPSVHYVPLNKYIIPSFGDERLLPYEYWIDNFKPDMWTIFNNNYDLMIGFNV